MTNPDDPGKETRLVPVKGRNIVVRQLNDAQLLLLGREARIASKEETDPNRRLAAVGRIFDILESQVVQSEDQEYLLDLTVQGDLEIKDLMDFITAFAEPGTKPKVRRGRYTVPKS